MSIGEANAVNAFARFALGVGPPCVSDKDRAVADLTNLVAKAYKVLSAGMVPAEVEPAIRKHLDACAQLDAAVYALVEAAEQRPGGWPRFSAEWPIERLEVTAAAFRRHEEAQMWEGEDRWAETDLRWWLT